MKELDHAGLDAYWAACGCWRLGAGAFAGAMLFGAIPSAMADDPALNPPNCTAGDLAQVSSGVSAGTSVYLLPTRRELVLHQPRGPSADQVRTEVAKYG
jgi:hypothetical protein